MNIAGWKELIAGAVASPQRFDRLAAYLAEVDEGRQLLRDAGFGVTGTPIIEQVKQAIKAAKDCPEVWELPGGGGVYDIDAMAKADIERQRKQVIP